MKKLTYLFLALLIVACSSDDNSSSDNESNCIPLNFNNDNSNQQQRFITLIDVLYEKSIPLMITSQSKLDLLSSSMNLKQFFKRTISRLYELTSIKYSYL